MLYGPQKQFGQKLFDFAISRRTLAMERLSIITFLKSDEERD
jgi:hypothetical protein